MSSIRRAVRAGAARGYNFTVESRTLRLLELDKILTRLEEAAASELGRARVRALKPVSKPAEVRRRLAETSEARRFCEMGKAPRLAQCSKPTICSP